MEDEIIEFARRLDELSNADVFTFRAIGEKAALELGEIIAKFEVRLQKLERGQRDES